MNIIISGYGKMGRLIEEMAAARGLKVAAVVDPLFDGVSKSGAAVYKTLFDLPQGGVNFQPAVVIDFTRPDAAFENIKAAAERGFPAVVGTTGWYEKAGEAESFVKNHNGALLYAPNFALGVQLFYKILAEASMLINKFDDYDVAGFEAHHNKKADSPSGTAKSMAELILKNFKRKKRAVYDKLDRPPLPEELHIASVRLGAVPGTHAVVFDSISDSIEIRHTTRNREGLAGGALFAAAWLGERFNAGARGIFTLEDVLS
ncbi:MAG: 4-hydroxy-tetrahydrodipicolinate reductase [Spirochaetaceae bacterium]|nr:4-hydroxy-tetrahydrodipicolinate reductase [Spirochaetaceae bacterium]